MPPPNGVRVWFAAALHLLQLFCFKCQAVAQRLVAWFLGHPMADACMATEPKPSDTPCLVLSTQGVLLVQDPDPSDHATTAGNRSAYLQGLRTGRTGATPEELTILARACGVSLRTLAPRSRCTRPFYAVTQAPETKPGAAVLELLVSRDAESPGGMLFARAPSHKKSAIKMARLARRGVKWPTGASLQDYARRLPLLLEISKRAPIPEAEPAVAAPPQRSQQLAPKERCGWPAGLHVPVHDQFCYAVAEARQWFGVPAVLDVVVRGQSQAALCHEPNLLAVCPRAASPLPWTEAELRDELLVPLLAKVRAAMAQKLNEAAHQADLDALVALSLQHGTASRRLGAGA